MLLPLSFDLKDREILLVGGGKAALEKFQQLKQTGCRLTIVARDFKPDFVQALKSETSSQVMIFQREFETQDVEGKFMVFSAVDDMELSNKIFRLCRQKKILINSADAPTNCDFFTTAIIDRGPVTVSVSTQGRFAGLSAILRRHLAELLPAELDADWERVFELRRRAIALQSVSEKKSVITNIVRDIEQKFFRGKGGVKHEQ